MFIAVYNSNLKVDKQKLAEALNVHPEDVYIEGKDFGIYPVEYYVDELSERADPVSYYLKSEIEDLNDMDDKACISIVVQAIDRIPDSIKIDIINQAIRRGVGDSTTIYEDDIIDDIDNSLSDYLLNHEEYLFPEN